MPSLMSVLNPEEMETAIIMIKKEIAMDAIAIFPPKRRRLAMKRDASMDILPNVDSLALRPPHRVSFLDSESVEEALEIAD